MSIESYYLDKEGLERLIDNIRRKYATQVSVSDLETELKSLIASEENRAAGRENEIETFAQEERNRIEGLLESEISTARENELRIDSDSQERDDAISETLSTQIQISRVKEGELETEDTVLQREIDDLESSKVSGVIVNGIDVVRNNIANIVIDKIVQASIQMVDELPDPEDPEPLNRPQNNILYILRDTHVIWQWNDAIEEYVEAGKFNVLLVDELPEIGDPQVLYILSSNHSINIYVGGEDPDERWQEISGQDKELREWCEAHTLDKIADVNEAWLPLLRSLPDYAPEHHTHNDVYYTKGEIDEMLEEGPVSHEEFNTHISAANPHPNMMSVIDSKLEDKADLDTVISHIMDMSSNPHKITKDMLGLENVENQSPDEIRQPVIDILTLKADKSYVDENLDTKLTLEGGIVDNLYTHNTDKALSANQGVELDLRVSEINTKVQSLGAALTFKGTVPSIAELPLLAEPGDSYQINSGTEGEHDGEMYAYIEEEQGGQIVGRWLQIVASAADLTSLIATDEEVHKIIEEYS